MFFGWLTWLAVLGPSDTIQTCLRKLSQKSRWIVANSVYAMAQKGLLRRPQCWVACLAIAGCIILFMFTTKTSESVVSHGVRHTAKSTSDGNELAAIQQSLESIRASLGAVADGRVQVDSLADIGASRRDVQHALSKLAQFMASGGQQQAAAGGLVPQQAAGGYASFSDCLVAANVGPVDMDPMPKDGGAVFTKKYKYVEADLGGWRTVNVQPDERFTIVGYEEKEHFEYYLFWARAMYGQWEPQTLAMMRALFDKNTLYIDFGMWIAPTVLYASRKAGEVWGLEADPAAYGEAARNVVANAADVTNVHLRRACISDKTAQNVPFYSYKAPGDSMGGLLWKPEHATKDNKLAKHTWYVDCFTLPEFVQRNNIMLRGRKVFVKIDTEGGEAVIAQTPGFKEWLFSNRVNLFLSIHIDHVASSVGKGSVYPDAGRRALADILAQYPHVYNDGQFQRGAVKKTKAEFYTDMCGSCTYLAMWDAPPAGFVQDMGQKEVDDEAEMERRRREWEASHPNE